jgi:hypothetical protein
MSSKIFFALDWGEVREEGIMPALPRNYYGGFEFFF